MEKNEFLLYNEIIYRIHACRSMEELNTVLLTQLKLLIPFTYASIVPIQLDPVTGDLIHGTPFCKPKQFEEVELAWISQSDRTHTFWLSHSPESVVIRHSEILEENPFPVEIYKAYQVQDCIQMNIVYDARVLGRMALHRTSSDGLFTERDAFYLRALCSHIDLAFYTCMQHQEESAQHKTPEEVAREYGLTRREEEILSLIFQNRNNEEILSQLCVSKNTLLKHLQNLYRKCEVSSRLELIKLHG